MKTKTTPEQSRRTLEMLDELCQRAAEVLFDKATVVYANLTDDERQKFSQDGTQLTRLAKILLCAVADEVEWQFSAECIKGDIKAVRRIRKNRYC